MSEGREKSHLKQKELDIIEPFGRSGVITACLRSTDEQKKVFTFFFEVRNDDTPKNGVSLNSIAEASNKLKRLQSLLDMVSRNIYIKSDMDKQLTDRKGVYGLLGKVSIESKQSHKYLSIIKMLLVLALCAGQVYFVTLFFTTGQKQRARPQK